jgi:thiol-disulfide isomerase/thioredoxin
MSAGSKTCAVHPNHSNKLALYAAVLCALVLLCGLLPPVQAAWEPEKLGRELTALPAPVKAPDFQLKDIDETGYHFADYSGKVVLLNFWATWCPPCRREMPSMERLHQMLGSNEFKVIAINQMENPDHVFAFTGQLDVDPTFPILFDRDSSVANAYKVKGLPTTYLIDKQGMIRYRAIGGREFDHPDVVKLIKQLIEE